MNLVRPEPELGPEILGGVGQPGRCISRSVSCLSLCKRRLDGNRVE